MCVQNGSIYAGFKFVDDGFKNIYDKILSKKPRKKCKSKTTQIHKFT